MWSLVKKEIRIALSSPVAIVAAALFLFLAGFAFTAQVAGSSPHQMPEASLRGLVYFLAIVLLFLVPLITMRSFAEERRHGTLELLKTAPLTETRIVFGKFAALLILLAGMLALTVELPIFLVWMGDPDPAPLSLSYLGLGLLAASFASVGLLASALTKNQVIAALVAFVFLLTNWFLPDVLPGIGDHLSTMEHLHNFTLGVLDLGDLVFYGLFTGAMLFLTVRVLESERWR